MAVDDKQRSRGDEKKEREQGTAERKQGRREIKAGRALWIETVPKVLPYAKPYWKLLAGSLAMSILGVIFMIAQPWPIALVIDEVLGGGEGGSGFLAGIAHAVVGTDQYAILAFAIFSVFALTALEGLSTLIGTYINTKLKLGMVLDFMSELFVHFQRLGLTFHNKARKGGMMNRVNQAPAALGEFVASAVPVVQSSLTLIGMLVVSAFIDWQVALAALLVMPLLYYEIGVYNSRVIPQLRAAGQLEMKVMSTTLEAMQMLRLIVSFGRERDQHARFMDEAVTANEARMKVTLRQTFFQIGVNAAIALGTALVLGLGALHVIQGKISLGELVVLMTYITAVYKPLQTLMTTLSSLNQQLVMLGFSIELLDKDPEIVESPRARQLPRADGRVTFEDVSFAYPGRKTTLEEIDFDIEPGKRVAVVGQTGSGKSTLASLLIRFYDPDKGRILVDGNDIRELTLRSLREQISVVLQEPLLMSGTIAENIRFGRLDATDDEVVAAAKAANAHDFITKLKDGYETELGERGPQVSGGEQQRICVARAFVKDAPILILDEPTSSVDRKTEAVIFEALDKLMEGRTSFVITHRLSTIRHSDLILVVKDGRIEAQGGHEELYERSELYRQLYGDPVERRGGDGAPKAGPARGGRFARRIETALHSLVDRTQGGLGTDGSRADDGEPAPVRDDHAAAEDPPASVVSDLPAPADAAFPSDLDLEPISRGPTRLDPATEEVVLSADLERLRDRAQARTSNGSPDVSIIAAVHDGLVFNRLCFESLIANTPRHLYELLIIDNGSRDGSSDYLRDLADAFPQVRLFRNARNLGFATAVNQGLVRARGDDLVLLNNDTIVPPGWLSGLRRHLRGPGVGIVGPVTNRIGNEAEIETSYETYGGMLELARRRARTYAGQALEIREPIMFCAALRREVCERVGLLDERYELGLFEDSDFALRCRRVGYRTVCAEDVFVHHFGGTTLGQLFPGGEHMTLFDANRERFERKWGERWQPHQRRQNADYLELRERIQALIAAELPPRTNVAIASGGDEALVDLAERRAIHFPRTERGEHTEVRPADSGEAISQLERLRADGADFLVFPETGLWWLEHYDGFRRHLEDHYRVAVRREGTCVVFALDDNGRNGGEEGP